MPVYYRASDAVVDHLSIDVKVSTVRRFPHHDLSGLHIVVPGGGVEGGVRLLGVSSLVAVPMTIPVIGHVSGLLAASVVVGEVFVAVACFRARPRQVWQLRACYQGRVVRVYSSSDRQVFAAFCRAVSRARESGVEHRFR
ncbi:hypothetical protein Acy02nite_06280 [Actinoplanes cyaneus]|uniref:Uncharacterized protein n=1 Tax=Actinoplanes cyaneus TaxID=52696 RepID=A0A919IE56_9ACTN|nr:DUF6232 family protein [Actinoplanes cyaneus]MCW2135887.1 hypothetical protein [Actinoplanes cyaneus]GID62747.1 hypothetical protein Acy02nite_06280 [Actinoplanes cyaneus]